MRVMSAAVLAVMFWAMKPILVHLLGDSAGYAEIYLTSASIACCVSAVLAVVMSRTTMQVLRKIRTHPSVLYNSIFSGFGLALWYYGFYRALLEAPIVEATLIAFTWVIISAVLMPYLGPKGITKLTISQWVLVVASFLGAVLIGVNGLHSTSGDPKELVWAVLAAIGSGLYLPFALKSIKSLESGGFSTTISTFYTISIANLAALVSVSTLLFASNAMLNFSTFTIQTWAIVGIIGVGIYLAAEIAWTWAFNRHNSLALSTLPYLSPPVSVLLLVLLFQLPLHINTIIGTIGIVAANLLLHWSRNKSASKGGVDPIEPDQRVSDKMDSSTSKGTS